MKANQLKQQGKIEVLPPAKKGRSLALTTVGHCRSELASIYRLAKAGTLNLQDACKYTYVLVALSKMVEASDTEQRLEQLEAALSGGTRA
jgi:hypothetical protein